MGKRIPKSRRKGPKNKAGDCKYGVNKITGHCLEGPRPKK